MDLERAGSIVRQVGNALSAAHREGIHHRDVKPENIMLQSLEDGEERVKLIDFGIASIRDARVASSGSSTNIAGTLTYMAPEQCQGRSSAASDIYALGVVAYELVTGRPPFTAENPIQLVGMLLEGVKVKPKDLRTNLPEAAQAAILKALAKNPEERFATAREFGEAFANGLAGSAQPPPPVQPAAERLQTSRLDLRVITAGVLIVAIAAVALVYWRISASTSTTKDDGKRTTAVVPTVVLPETNPAPPLPSIERSSPSKGVATVAKGTIATKEQPELQAGAVKVNPKDGQRYRWIPPGTFEMGCSDGDVECVANEKPARTVTLTRGFWIGETEVTQAAYQKVSGQNPSTSKGAALPVDNVNWHDAQSYCEAVGMRLPTEAEWEYAARAGSLHSRYGDLVSIAWYRWNSEGKTHDVGQKRANAWGLHDTLGNLWEWMADWHSANLSNSETDPGGPAVGEYRSTRGGNFNVAPPVLRVSVRRRDPPGRRSDYIGFRCVESSVIPRTTANTVVNPAAGAQQVNPRDGLTYVWIPPGTFRMGCSVGDPQCSPNESPAKQITLTKGFWIGQTEVTREAYPRVITSMPPGSGENRMPVGSVTWEQAQAYCRAAGLRLPTEAEWEYAARGGSSEARYGELNAVAWWVGNSDAQVHRVAGKQPNTHGLYDMLGNQREWVADWYDASYYSRVPDTDPEGPQNGQARVLRGGAWKGVEDRIRVSTRLWSQLRALEETNGFRCAGATLPTR
jgi:formylglycine-generating enzyme required for sulfatase activity